MVRDRKDRADSFLSHIRNLWKQGRKASVGLFDNLRIFSGEVVGERPLRRLGLLDGHLQPHEEGLQKRLDEFRILPDQGAPDGHTHERVRDFESPDVDQLLESETPGHESRGRGVNCG